MNTTRLTPSVSACNLHRQRGASLLEGIAYLGIAAIIILGAVALLSSAFSGANTNRGYEEVTAIRTGVKRLYMGQSASYGSGSLNSTLISAKVFPTSLSTNSDGDVKNTWNGDVTVTGDGGNFTISYGSVPKDVCINMISGSGGWVSVKVGTTALTPPVSPAAAIEECSGTSNTIVWTAN